MGQQRRRDFYIAQIVNETSPKKEAPVEAPLEETVETKPHEFVSPFLGRQKNTVSTPPAVARGNKGFQYEGYRKQKKLTPEELEERYGNKYYGTGVLSTEEYREILTTGTLRARQPLPPEEITEEINLEPVEIIQGKARKDDRYEYFDDKTPRKVKPQGFTEELIVDEQLTKPQFVQRPIPAVVTDTKYQAPPLGLLKKQKELQAVDTAWAENCGRLINQTFADYNFGGAVAGYIQGPSVTQFLISIKTGTNVKNITGLEKDLMRYLEVRSIRIQDPIPGTSYAGIEIPNYNRRNVLLGNLIDNPKFLKSEDKLLVALGIDISGEEVYGDIAKMPHGLIAGATNSGKSVCINSMLISLLYKNSPEELRLILIDPKMVELSSFDETPHLAMPVITDAKMASSALRWTVEEMEQRFSLFKENRVRNIDGYNELMAEIKGARMPRIIIVIDELADLIMIAASEVESNIQRLTQKARAAGIHVIVATQRPSTDIIRGSIKNNILVRAAFRVASNVDSRTILDHGGAETLLGNGDMLYLDTYGERRLQGAFISDGEIIKITNHLRDHNQVMYLATLSDLEEPENPGDDAFLDPLFDEVARYAVRMDTGSNNKITQAFKISFNRADRILVAMESLGIVSSTIKGKQREVLVSEKQLTEILTRK